MAGNVENAVSSTAEGPNALSGKVPGTAVASVVLGAVGVLTSFAVLPGLMDTPMARASAQSNWGASPEQMDEVWKARAERVPMKWLGDAWDIARASAFLASDDASHCMGTEIAVDGGMTAGTLADFLPGAPGPR